MSTTDDKPKVGRPPTGVTPKRYFRMAHEDWIQIESAAKASGETTSEYIRRVILKDSAKVLKTQ